MPTTPVHLKMASQAETCSEIVSNKGTVNEVALRRRRNPLSQMYTVKRDAEI
jgi:hypothetical protein